MLPFQRLDPVLQGMCLNLSPDPTLSRIQCIRQLISQNNVVHDVVISKPLGTLLAEVCKVLRHAPLFLTIDEK